MAVQPFLVQRFTAQSAGIALIRGILKENVFPDGYVTTKELYKLAAQKPAPPNFEPFPVKVLGPAPAIRRPKGKSPPNAKVRVIVSNHPEHPEHPIRSIRFLKEYVLPHLQGNNEIIMKCKPRSKTPNAESGSQKKITASSHKWAWKIIPPEERPVAPAPPKAKKIVGTEVGVGEDISHLNRRRTKARVGKVSRAITRLKAYQYHENAREKLLPKIENNEYILKKVSKAWNDNPDSDPPMLLWAAEDAAKTMPKQFWQDRPIESEIAKTRLKHLRKTMSWRQPDPRYRTYY